MVLPVKSVSLQSWLHFLMVCATSVSISIACVGDISICPDLYEMAWHCLGGEDWAHCIPGLCSSLRRWWHVAAACSHDPGCDRRGL